MFFAFTFALPDGRDGRLIGVEPKEQGAVEEAGDEKVILMVDGCGDGVAGRERMLPINGAGGRIEANDVFGGPADKDVFTGVVYENG